MAAAFVMVHPRVRASRFGNERLVRRRKDVEFEDIGQMPREGLARNPPFEPAQSGERQAGGKRRKECRIEKADAVNDPERSREPQRGGGSQPAPA